MVIGGSEGNGLESARMARSEGAEIVLTGRDPERLHHAGRNVEARTTATFDAHDAAALEFFFEALPDAIDHVLVNVGAPSYRPALELTPDEARRELSAPLLLSLEVARNAVGRIRPGGTLLLLGGTGGWRIAPRSGTVNALTAGLSALTACLAVELDPVRVNLIAPGFGPADAAALAVELMIDTAITGATYAIDSGRETGA